MMIMNVTPQPELPYEADNPQNSAPWGVLRLTRTGPNRITVENAPVVMGYAC
jgi:hypothetical protein